MSIFSTVPVQKPRMSAFDLSYNNYFTCNMGELIPAFVLPIMPNDRIQYAPTFQVRFAPMVNPVYADIYAKVECFFIPYRLVWNNWKSFITGIDQLDDNGSTVPPTKVPLVVVPAKYNGKLADSALLGGARVADFLGAVGFWRYVDSCQTSAKTLDDDVSDYRFNCLPFRAYTLVWNEYYRDEFVELPYKIGANNSGRGTLQIDSSDVNLTSYAIFRRRWAKDYFTTATPNPQYGSDASGVTVTINGSDVSSLSGFFTVAQFRVANALQRFLERTNIGGGRYNEFILAHFGCMPTDATIQRPEFLGSVTAPVQVMAVNQTSQSANDIDSRTASNTLAAQAGQMSAVGTNMCFRRSFKEYGVIIGLFSAFPRPVYSGGISRYLRAGVSFGDYVKGSRYDYCFPEFAGVGDQVIYRSELVGGMLGKDNDQFGYQQRYAEFKFHADEVHGDFSRDSSLSRYTFARFFDDNYSIKLNSDFLECVPRSDCFVLSDSNDTNYILGECWVQLRNNVKAIRPLPKFSTPTL